MLKLLIVEDEEIIYQTLARLMDWSSMQIELIGICQDGVDAYHMILDECPDIVMTDINMPGISGLELIERIHRTALDTRFVILSGYAEFDYAKRAMKSGVRHYLLKPCEEEQLRSALQEVAQECMHLKQEKNTSYNTIQDFQIQRVMLQNMIREGIRLPNISTKLFETNAPYLNLYEQPYQYCALYYLEKKYLNSAMKQIRNYFYNESQNIRVHAIYTVNILLLIFPDYTSNYQTLDHFFEDDALSRTKDQP